MNVSSSSINLNIQSLLKGQPLTSSSKALPLLKPIPSIVEKALPSINPVADSSPITSKSIVPVSTLLLPPLAHLPSITHSEILKEEKTICLKLPSCSNEKPSSFNMDSKIEVKTIQYPDGSSYEGDVCLGKRHGFGKMFNPQGKFVSDGVYKNDVLNSHGEWHFDDGFYYEGMFFEGKFHGYGTIRNRDHDIIWEGCFDSGNKVQGQENYDNKSYYIGFYENQKKSNGYLVEYGTLKIIYQGPFKNGKPLEKKGTLRDSISSISPSTTIVASTPNSPLSIQQGLSQRPSLSSTIQIGGTLNEDNLQHAKKNGYAILKDDKGNITYKGFFKDGLQEGYGEAFFEDGSSYIGFFSKGKYDGFGVFTRAWDNNVIIGIFKAGKIETGKEYYSKHTVFFGTFKDGEKDEGVLLDADSGEVFYCGKFQGGEPHGSPIWWNRGGTVYEGNCFAGKFFGKVKKTRANGEVWIGKYAHDLPHGIGTLVDKDGNLLFHGMYYKGEKVDGFFRLPSGKYYQGPFFNDQPNGHGSIRDRSGKKTYYEGEFYNGNKQGMGTQYLDNGTTYIGDFFNDNRHGTGRIYNKNGEQIFFGKFKNGCRVTRNITLPPIKLKI